MSVPLQIKDIKVRSLDVDFHEITWELAPTSEDVLDYTFIILRSQGPMGPFSDLTPAMEDQFVFIDNNIKINHKYRRYYYKVRVTRKLDGEYEDFGPASISAEPDLIALELRKHMNLLFREFAGRRCWVLPVRTFGQRCQCWNSTLQKRTRSGCITCFDTGFVRGYMHPVESWVQFDPSANTEQQVNTGITQQKNTTARMGYFPPVKPRDVIVEPENKRWRVTQVNTTQQLRAPVHQEIQVHEIPKSDIEYAVELQLEKALKDLFLSPSRNFTNPQNLENFENDEIPTIYNLYSSTYPTVKV